MDFLDPKKKRAHQIRLYIGYGLMAVALGIGTLILVFSAYGYDIDRRTGGIIQNGLITVDSHPVAANILVNGTNKGTTSNRLVLPSGQYQIELQREGYRPWQHSVSLEGSSIEQLVYPILFPTTLVTKALQPYPVAPTMASQSPDQHWLVIGKSTPGSFDVVDLSNNKNTLTAITLPSDTVTQGAGEHRFEAIEWAADDNHLLLKHSFGNLAEFILLDRAVPTSSINLNKIFAPQAFTAIGLRDKKSDQFYLYNSTGSSLFTADSKTKLATLVSNRVLTYKPYKSNILLYTAPLAGSTTNVEVRVHEGDQDYLLRTIPAAATYLLDMAPFQGHFYLAVGSPADGRVYIYKDPLQDLGRHPAQTPHPLRVLIVPGAQYVSFSEIARFIAVQSGSLFAVYDAETGRQFRYDTKLPLPAGQKATWMDGHRLTLVSDGTVVVFDFDGTNVQKLSAGLPAFMPWFDKDYSAMFTFAPDKATPDKPVLTRTELKVLPAGSSNQ